MSDIVIQVTPPAPVVIQVGTSGPQGPSGSPADIVAVEAVETIAAGQVVKSNTTGKLVLAQADTFTRALSSAVAKTSAAIGFTAEVADGFLTLPSWLASTGSADLQPGVEYFLSASIAGRMTATPPGNSGECVCSIGRAINARTLKINIQGPFRL